MGLRERAEADLSFLLEDAATGFGWNVTITSPAGLSADLVGMSTDIGQAIDVQTGMVVSGRSATLALRIASLSAAGFEIPTGVMESDARPWVVEFLDINGAAHVFKITATEPDRTLGLVLCRLEFYKQL